MLLILDAMRISVGGWAELGRDLAGVEDAAGCRMVDFLHRFHENWQASTESWNWGDRGHSATSKTAGMRPTVTHFDMMGELVLAAILSYAPLKRKSSIAAFCKQTCTTAALWFAKHTVFRYSLFFVLISYINVLYRSQSTRTRNSENNGRQPVTDPAPTHGRARYICGRVSELIAHTYPRKRRKYRYSSYIGLAADKVVVVYILQGR